MIVYFMDRGLNILGKASTDLPNSIGIIDDTKTMDVDSGTIVLECVIPFDKSSRLKVEGMCNAGNYILKKQGDESEFYTIIDAELDTNKGEISIYAEDGGLDLLNDVVILQYTADKAYPIKHYIEKLTDGTGFEIGRNEISGLTRTLRWDGNETVTELLLFVADKFDNAEISFSFEIENMVVTRKYINIYKKRGIDTGYQLRIDKDINNIIIKKSVANLATSIFAVGGTPEGEQNPITLNGYAYDDGDIYQEGGHLKSRTALAKWGRVLHQPEEWQEVYKHIEKEYTYETTSQSELFNRTLEELKKVCDMEVNYEVDIEDLPAGLTVGDTLSIVDDTGELYLTARILKLETSVSRHRNVAVIGDYLIQDSGISEKVEALAANFAELAKKRTLYTWIAYADDEKGSGISINPEGKKYIGTAANRLSGTIDISDPSAYTWALFKGAQGNPGEKGDPGNDGRGIVNTEISYQASDSNTVIPAGTWAASPPDVPPGDYLWTRTVITYTDETKTTSYSIAKQGTAGAKGDPGKPTGVTVSAAEPTDKYTGMLWKHIGSVAGLVNGATYRWSGAVWELWIVESPNIAANSITTEKLAADAIKSSNYNYATGNFSTSGAFLNLADGTFKSKYFALTSNGAYFKGDVTAYGLNVKDTINMYLSEYNNEKKSVLDYNCNSMSAQYQLKLSTDTAGTGHPYIFFRRNAANADGNSIELSASAITASGAMSLTKTLTVAGQSFFKNGLELSHPSSTPFIDFHHSSTHTGEDFTSRIIESASGILGIGGRTWGYLNIDSVGGCVYPSTDGGLSLGLSDHRFYALRVSNGVDNSSREELKTDIQPFTGALSEIENTDVYGYRLKEVIQREGTDIVHTGFVIGKDYRLSEFLLSKSGEGIDLYSAIGVTFAGVKELYEIVKRQQELIQNLKEKIL